MNFCSIQFFLKKEVNYSQLFQTSTNQSMESCTKH